VDAFTQSGIEVIGSAFLFYVVLDMICSMLLIEIEIFSMRFGDLLYKACQQ